MNILDIRPAAENDFEAIWEIFHAVVAKGDTFAYAPDSTREDARALWMGPGTHAYVAMADGVVAGSYFLRANQPGLGNHVANAGYMVHAAHGGKGIGKAMCEHSLGEARKLGFKAMQFNFVVSTNENAVILWKNMGFRIVGTLPGAFRHALWGPVNVYVMFREL